MMLVQGYEVDFDSHFVCSQTHYCIRYTHSIICLQSSQIIIVKSWLELSPHSTVPGLIPIPRQIIIVTLLFHSDNTRHWIDGCKQVHRLAVWSYILQNNFNFIFNNNYFQCLSHKLLFFIRNLLSCFTIFVTCWKWMLYQTCYVMDNLVSLIDLICMSLDCGRKLNSPYKRPAPPTAPIILQV